MGREVKRVPMDFDFPLGRSYADATYDEHCDQCDKKDHDECDYSMNVPKGGGWQLWQTVSDGPISPVFATPEELIDFMCQPVPVEQQRQRECFYGKDADPAYPSIPRDMGWRREVAEKFVKSIGWAPSLVIQNGVVMGGAEAMVKEA